MCIQLKSEAFNSMGHEVSGDKGLKSLLCTVGQWPGDSQRESYLKGKKEGTSGDLVSGRLRHVIQIQIMLASLLLPH